MAGNGLTVKMDWSGVDKLCDSLVKDLKSVKGVKAGYFKNQRYPAEKEESTKEMPLVRDVALWNEYGTDTIPARPFLRNALKDQKEWAKTIIDNFDANQDGTTKLKDIAKTVGVQMQSSIQESITRTLTPPNAPSTIKKKKGKSHPLIDSGILRSSVHNEVIKK